MAATETVALANGWYKELRTRKKGKQAGSLYVCCTDKEGKCYDSRVKAEKHGCVDPAHHG